MTRDLQQQKPRYPKRPQLSPIEAGTLKKRIAHTAAYKQKVNQYTEALKQYGLYIDKCSQNKLLN